MAEWSYGGAYERYPCDRGTVHFTDGSTVKVCSIMNGLPNFMRKADIVFTDPPWNQGNIRSFYTKANMTDDVEYCAFVDALFDGVREINPRICYLEVGKESLAMFIDNMTKQFKYVTFYNSTYYHKETNLCYIVRGSTKPHRGIKLDGMDEEDIISWVCANEEYDCIADLCIGRGLVGINAYKNNRRFVGTELNHKRLSVLIENIVQSGGRYIIKEEA